MHPILEEQEKKFEEKFEYDSEDTMFLFCERNKDGSRTIVDDDDIKSFLRLSNLAVAQAVLKMVEEKMPKHMTMKALNDSHQQDSCPNDWEEYGYNTAVRAITTTLTEIKKSLTNEQ